MGGEDERLILGELSFRQVTGGGGEAFEEKNTIIQIILFS